MQTNKYNIGTKLKIISGNPIGEEGRVVEIKYHAAGIFYTLEKGGKVFEPFAIAEQG